MTTQISRGALIFEGILFIILGILAIALPVASTIATELFIGWLLLIGGIFQLYRAFKSLKHSEFYMTLLSGLLNIALGVLFIIYPGIGIVTLTLLLPTFLDLG
jgi:uncharacterized membrane protein HdeD (DUF308 family)